MQCTPLLVEKAGVSVAPVMTFGITACKSARKSADEISTLDLKPMRKDTQSPKQEQSVAPKNGPSFKQFFFKKINLSSMYVDAHCF